MTFDYTVLEPGLAVSEHPREPSRLAELPFDAVLNVCDFCEPSYASGLRASIAFARWPFEDCWPVPFPLLTAAVLELADLRGRGVPTLVHCHLGRSRSPTVVALYWMARDGIDWPTAVARFEARRPCHLSRSGSSALAGAAVRARVLDVVAAFLRGETGLLHHYRERADRLVRAFGQRPADPAPRGSDWTVIDDGLAVGESASSWPALASHGYDRILIIGAPGAEPAGRSLPPDVPTAVHNFLAGDGIDAAVLGTAVRQLDAWAREGRRVYVLGPGEDFYAVVTVCVWRMVTHDWDAASAIWYVGSRRPAVSRYLELLADVNLEGLAGACRAR